jgi:hypothetical protein
LYRICIERQQSAMKKLESEAAINAQLRSITEQLRRSRLVVGPSADRSLPERGIAADARKPQPKPKPKPKPKRKAPQKTER